MPGCTTCKDIILCTPQAFLKVKNQFSFKDHKGWSLASRLAHLSKTSDFLSLSLIGLTRRTFDGKIASGCSDNSLMSPVSLLWLSLCLAPGQEILCWILLETLLTFVDCCLRHLSASSASAKFLSLLDTWSIPFHAWYRVKHGTIPTIILFYAHQHSVLVQNISVGMKAFWNVTQNEMISA